MEYLGEIISGLSALGVAFIGIQGARTNKRHQEDKERSERRAADRMKESRLAMQLMDASLELNLATALAVRCGKTNGEMAAAEESAEAARAKYGEFIQGIASRQIAKV